MYVLVIVASTFYLMGEGKCDTMCSRLVFNSVVLFMHDVISCCVYIYCPVLCKSDFVSCVNLRCMRILRSVPVIGNEKSEHHGLPPPYRRVS